MAEQEWISEGELAKAFAVPRETLAGCRRSLPAADLKKTALGFEWRVDVAEAVAIKLRLPWVAPAKKSGAVDMPEWVTVLRRTPSPIIIYCRRGNGEQITVRVRNNAGYGPLARDGKPMRILVRRAGAGGNNTWFLAGREPIKGMQPL